MTDNEKIFLILLSKAIKDDNNPIELGNVNWNQLYKLAVNHDVCSLLYSQIKKANLNLPEEVANEWRNITIVSSIQQINLVTNVNEALRLLSEASIDVIAVKGIFLKFLYPDPVLRTMGDADFLIHREDFPRITQILNAAGFRNDTLLNEDVTTFEKGPFFRIDVHSNLVSEHAFKYAGTFINPWENAIFDSEICKYGKLLSIEDCFIYTVVHIAKHLSKLGHGIRQLCDLALLTEKYMNKINWGSIIERLSGIELKNLTDILFSICNKYLNMPLPSIWLYENPEVEKVADVLVEYILKCGVFGYAEGKNTKVLALRQTKKHLFVKSNLLSLIAYMLNQFFPRYVNMRVMYKYLVKYPVLLPYAWFARMCKYFKNKKRYNMEINEIITSINDVDDEIKLQKALGLDKIFM